MTRVFRLKPPWEVFQHLPTLHQIQTRSMLVSPMSYAPCTMSLAAWLRNRYQGPVMLVSSDGGSSWNSAVDDNLEGRDIRAVSVDSANAEIAYAATDQGLYQTTNGGDTWTELPVPAANSSAYAVAVDPGDSNHLLVSIDRDATVPDHRRRPDLDENKCGSGAKWIYICYFVRSCPSGPGICERFAEWRLPLGRFWQQLDQDQHRPSFEGDL